LKVGIVTTGSEKWGRDNSPKTPWGQSQGTKPFMLKGQPAVIKGIGASSGKGKKTMKKEVRAQTLFAKNEGHPRKKSNLTTFKQHGNKRD